MRGGGGHQVTAHIGDYGRCLSVRRGRGTIQQCFHNNVAPLSALLQTPFSASSFKYIRSGLEALFVELAGETNCQTQSEGSKLETNNERLKPLLLSLDFSDRSGSFLSQVCISFAAETWE